VEKVTQVYPLFYLIKTNGLPTVLNLNLSYEKGFKAYNLNCSQGFDCVVKAFLAPIFEKEIASHVIVDNWANGWVLKPNENQIAIVFVPEYFQFLGFLLIFFIFLLLFFHHKTK
jgi:hypothetical protein